MRAFTFALALGAGILGAASCKGTFLPQSDEDCRESEGCHGYGRCTFDRGTNKCVVGSGEDCAQSRICQKDLLCVKVGDTCAKE